MDVGASAGSWVYALWCREDPHLHLHGSLFEVHPSNFGWLRDKYGHCYEPVRRWVGEWEPIAAEPENDIEATGSCCCNGCVGEGICDLGDGRDDDAADTDCPMCPADCQICSGTPHCDCPTHGDDDGTWTDELDH